MMMKNTPENLAFKPHTEKERSLFEIYCSFEHMGKGHDKKASLAGVNVDYARDIRRKPGFWDAINAEFRRRIAEHEAPIMSAAIKDAKKGDKDARRDYFAYQGKPLPSRSEQHVSGILSLPNLEDLPAATKTDVLKGIARTLGEKGQK